MGSGADVGVVREGLCASIAPCVGDVSYEGRSGIRQGEVTDARERYEDAVDGKQATDEVDRDVSDG